MKDTGRSPMVKLFLTSYEDFKVRLRRRLGSEDGRALFESILSTVNA